MTGADLPEVVVIPNVGYGVRSASVPGAYRIVRGAGCSCPAGENGARSCRHRRAVAEFCASRSREYARPVAVAHISALVD